MNNKSLMYLLIGILFILMITSFVLCLPSYEITSGTKYEFDTEGTDNSLVKINTTHYLNTYSDSSGYGSAIVLVVNQSDWTITSGTEHDFDTGGGEYNSLVKINTTHYLNTYNQGTDINAVVLVVNGLVVSSPFDSYDFDSNSGIYESNSLTQINETHYLNTYTGVDGDGFAVVLVVNMDNLTITSGDTYEFNTSFGWMNSLTQINETHYLNTYSNGNAVVLVVNMDNLTITSGDTYEFDNSYTRYNSLTQINETHYLNTYYGADEDGFAVVLVVNMDNLTITSGDTHEFDTTSAEYNSLVKIDTAHYLNVYEGADGDGYSVILTVNMDTLTITSGTKHEFDTTNGRSHSLKKVDLEHYINAYDGNSATGDGTVVILTVNITSNIELISNITKPDNVYQNTDWLINLTAKEPTQSSFNSYVQFYVNDTKIGDEINYTIQNNTNSLVATLDNGNFTTGDILIAEFWLGDDYANTTHTNISEIVQNSISVSLNEPDDDSIKSSSVDFNCSVESGINDLQNITLYVWNSTGSIYNQTNKIISGSNNESTLQVNFTYDDTFKWNCLAYNDIPESNWASSNFTLTIDTTNTAITISKPQNNFHRPSGDLQVNYTPVHSTQEVSSCSLYGNFTGEWGLNQTNLSITEDVINTFNLNLDDSTYIWSIWCNTTIGTENYMQDGNYSLTIDSISPTGNNITVTTTAGSQSIQFLTDISDNRNLSYCTYTIRNLAGGVDGISENVSFTCNSETDATVSGFATYNLYVYAFDLAGNNLTQNISFTTSASTGKVITGGSSGGTTIIEGTGSWEMTTSTGSSSYYFSVAQGSTKTKRVLFENLGESAKTITLGCENLEGDLCQYVTFDENPFSLPLIREIETSREVIISLPKDAIKGQYSFNIVASDGANKGIITFNVNVDPGIIIEILTKLGSSFNFGKYKMPYAIVFFPLMILIGFGSYFLFLNKLPIGALYSLLLAIIIPSITILMIG